MDPEADTDSMLHEVEEMFPLGPQNTLSQTISIGRTLGRGTSSICRQGLFTDVQR